MKLWPTRRPKSKAGDKPIGACFLDSEGGVALDMDDRLTYMGWDEPGTGKTHVWTVKVTPEEAQLAAERRWNFWFEEIPPKTTVHIVTEVCE